ncbi:MAG: guanylate kinase [Candidatus Aminicenantes bacterium]|nr:guanylate kinase [Candidatus Aminicenantes bacterium]TET18708.1 MAG: guanylate kinase [Candidatus Aminicenantes bacterium]
MLFVITGPSGCGKSTLAGRVLEELDNIDFSVSYTTRKKRNSEEEGKDYYFVSEGEFKRMMEDMKLVEWAVVHGNYYGTSKRELEKKATKGDILLDIDVQGAHQIKEKFKKTVFIFIMPPLYLELKKRLEKRGEESPESINERLDVAKKEIRHYHHFDYIIINDLLEKAVEELKSIILSTRCRFDPCKKEIMLILRSFSEEL